MGTAIRQCLARVFAEAHHLRWMLAAAFVATCYVIGSSYLGLNGGNTFRQADAYSQTLGFAKAAGFKPLDLFESGRQAVFDIPIYQALIGTLARLSAIDPLILTRFVNLACLFASAWYGYRLCLQLLTAEAGIVFVLLLGTSRLFEHYHAVPLPDNLGMALSIYAVHRLIGRQTSWPDVLMAMPALVVATLIKSPVPFVFIVFMTVYWLLSARQADTPDAPTAWAPRIAVLMACLLSAVLAEQMRRWLLGSSGVGFAQDPRWYFGALSMRLEPYFWDRVLGRLFSFSSQLFLPVMLACVAIAASGDRIPQRIAHVLLSALAGYLAGWLVFSNVYYIHDYYTMPAALMAIIGFAGLFAAANEKYASQAANGGGTTAAALLNAAVLLALLLASARLVYHPLSDRARASFTVAAQYALKDKPYFVFVRNSGYDPSLAGSMATKYLQVSPDDAARDCVTLRALHDAFLLKADHPCAQIIRDDATAVLKAPDEQILVVVR